MCAGAMPCKLLVLTGHKRQGAAPVVVPNPALQRHSKVELPAVPSSPSSETSTMTSTASVRTYVRFWRHFHCIVRRA